MARKFNLAVVGATGAVGEAMISILEERAFPIDEISFLASEKSAGKRIGFRNKQIPVRNLADHDFSGADIALFSAGAGVSREHAPRAIAAGCTVIDNTSEYRCVDEIPLVISEVNPEALDGFSSPGIIANPNCSTMQMLVALAPIHRAVGIERINVATYQSVSGAGARGVEELARQTTALLNFQPLEKQQFPDQIAFNVIPHIDTFQDNGYTREEMKMVWETRKILGDPEIGVNPTAVRVPVFCGHAEAVHIETRTLLPITEARALLASASGVEVIDQHRDGGYPTPVSHASGSDAVFVGRIRKDLSHPRGIDLWIVSDNVRKGAALNAVQIAELLVNYHL